MDDLALLIYTTSIVSKNALTIDEVQRQLQSRLSLDTIPDTILV